MTIEAPELVAALREIHAILRAGTHERERLARLLDGNGKPALIVRLDRLEEWMTGQKSALLTARVALVAAALSFVADLVIAALRR